MADSLHLEAKVEPGGTVRLYLSDFWRNPIAPSSASGTVTLGPATSTASAAERRTLPLAADADSLVAVSPLPAGQDQIEARFELKVNGEPVEIDFTLPVGLAAGGAPGTMAADCSPPVEEPSPGRHSPRCVLHLERPVSALAATADGAKLLVAAVDLGVSEWRLPEGRLVLSFEPPPAVNVPGPEGLSAHSDSVGAIALAPDGALAIVALEGRLLRYTIPSGRIIGELPRLGGIARSLAFSPDGERLLVTVFYDPAARLLRADDGAEVLRLPIEREGSAAAFSPNGRLFAVGSEAGPLSLFDLTDGRRVRELRARGGWPQALGFAAGRPTERAGAGGEELLIAAGSDGVLRVWDARNGRLRGHTRLDQALTRLAVEPGGKLVAVGGRGGAVWLYGVATGSVEKLEWHAHAISGLAWAGPLLVSGDVDGNVGLWEVGERR